MRVRRFFRGLLPATLAGAFFFMILGRVDDPGASRVGMLLLGGLYGIGIVGLIRLFRIAPWGYPVVGLLAGPLPLALLVTVDMSKNDRGGALVLTALLGVFVGLVEWARVRAERGPADPD